MPQVAQPLHLSWFTGSLPTHFLEFAMSTATTSVHTYRAPPAADRPRPPLGGLDPQSKEAELFNALRPIRRLMAAKHGVPPYFILSDASLADLVVVRPANADILLCVKGFGPGRLATYGEDVLLAVREQARQLGMSLADVPPDPARPTSISAKSAAPADDSVRQAAFAAFTGGESIAAVCVAIDRSPNAVVALLAQFAAANGLASLEPWLNDALLSQIEAQLAVHGGDRLKPVYLALGEQVPYTLLRLARAFLPARLGAEAPAVARRQ